MQIGIGLLGGLSVLALVCGWSVMRPTPLDRHLALFFGCLALSTVVSGHPLQAVGWLKVWTVLAYFVVYWWLDGAGGARRFLSTLAGSGALAAVYGVIQHFTGIDWYRQLLGRQRRVRPRTHGDPRFAVVGFFRNYLTFAHTMSVPYASALSLGLSTDGRWTIAAVVIMTAILFSSARGAWLAVLASTVTVVAIGRGRRAGVVVLAMVAVGAIAVGQSDALQKEIGSMFALSGENAGRVAIYEVNLQVVHDHPWFGLGFGRYLRAARPYYLDAAGADRRSHAHNNFLQVAAESGLVGLAAFALLFAHALRLGLDAVHGPAPPARATAVGAFAAIVGFLVGGLTQYTFGDGEVAIAMWCTLAVLMRCRPGDA